MVNGKYSLLKVKKFNSHQNYLFLLLTVERHCFAGKANIWTHAFSDLYCDKTSASSSAQHPLNHSARAAAMTDDVAMKLFDNRSLSRNFSSVWISKWICGFHFSENFFFLHSCFSENKLPCLEFILLYLKTVFCSVTCNGTELLFKSQWVRYKHIQIEWRCVKKISTDIFLFFQMWH